MPITTSRCFRRLPPRLSWDHSCMSYYISPDSMSSLKASCVLLHGFRLLLHMLYVDQLRARLLIEKPRYNNAEICTETHLSRRSCRCDAVTHRLLQWAAFSSNSRSTFELWLVSLSLLDWVTLHHTLVCLSQTYCNKAFPSLAKFNSSQCSFWEMHVWPLCCYAEQFSHCPNLAAS